MREIKFRAWDGKRMVFFDTLEIGFKKSKQVIPYVFFKNDTFAGQARLGSHDVMQYTGKKTIHNKDLYEGDIVFVEEAEETGDKRYYLVIIWIEEWSMFASLHVSEYQKFIQEGVKALDEPLFWTYTLENSYTDFHYAGNIHQNPDLLLK